MNFAYSSPMSSGFASPRVFEALPPDGAYERMILVSHIGQLNHPSIKKPGTFVLTTDWLVWRRLLRGNIPCAHFEGLLRRWPTEITNPDDLFIMANTWMYESGKDVTRFRGVSLGKLYCTSIAILNRAHIRIGFALDQALVRWRPSTLIHVDCYADFGTLSPEARRELVAGVAARHNIPILEDLAPLERAKHVLEAEDAYDPAEPEQRGWRARVIAAYSLIVDAVTGVANKSMRNGKHRAVYVYHNPNMTTALLAAARGTEVLPVVSADVMPKRVDFLAQCLRDGVRLAYVSPPKLRKGDRERLVAMARDVRRVLAKDHPNITPSLRHFVIGTLMDGGQFERCAAIVNSIADMLDRVRPSRILVGDAGNLVCRTLLECGREKGIPCDELLNGIFFSPTRWDVRNGDGVNGPLIARLLTWGEANELWHAQSGSTVPTERTGNPVTQAVPRASSKTALGRNVLLLPLSTDSNDVRALRANVFSYLRDTAEMLVERGFAVRVKLHPGRPNERYYREVLAGLPVQVFKAGTIHDHMGWADYVIGPPNSGALVETLAAGRPYHVIIPDPTSILPFLLGPIPINRTPKEAVEAVTASSTRNWESVLAHFCDLRGDSATRVWKAMENA
jgi:hypothetical protein